MMRAMTRTEKWIGTATVMTFSLLQQPVLAHPGHGHGEADPHTLLHYVLEPAHAIPALAGVAVVLGLIKYCRDRRRGRRDERGHM